MIRRVGHSVFIILGLMELLFFATNVLCDPIDLLVSEDATFRFFWKELNCPIVFCDRNGLAFAALMTDGSLVTWGYSVLGGDSSAVADQLKGDVAQIYSNDTLYFQIH